MALSSSGKLVSVAYDDSCRTVSVKSKQFDDATVATDGQPKCVATTGEFAIIGTNKEVAVV